MHILILGLMPDPITPWLFFACAYGERGLPVTFEQTQMLDPALANVLEPWFRFRCQDGLPPQDYGSPVRQLLINHLDIQDVSEPIIWLSLLEFTSRSYPLSPLRGDRNSTIP
jgi:hypothetical protein